MSVENARQFLAAAQEDPALRAKLQNLEPATAAIEVAMLAMERGLDFSATEFAEALSGSGELDEASLAQVSGGVLTNDDVLRLFREYREKMANQNKP